MSSAAGSAPSDAQRTIVVTFDNLGEASERQRATWPPGAPPGVHPSVTRVLPRLLDELDGHGLRATFFVEAINCELYPAELHEIEARGHELGAHGWMHEPWAQLSLTDERGLLARGTRAFAELGVEVRAFRPPGGEPTVQTERLLGELGYAWYSPAGGEPGAGEPGSGDRGDALARVPFDWELVDAYHLMERFGELRRRRGDDPATLLPDALTTRLTDALVRGTGVQTVVMHPFLMLDDAWFDGVRQVLTLIGEMAREGDARVVPGGRLAAWIMQGGR